MCETNCRRVARNICHNSVLDYSVEIKITACDLNQQCLPRNYLSRWAFSSLVSYPDEETGLKFEICVVGLGLVLELGLGLVSVNTWKLPIFRETEKGRPFNHVSTYLHIVPILFGCASYRLFIVARATFVYILYAYDYLFVC